MTHKLSRDCPATVIPAGDAVTLPAGSDVFITQTLGGNVTVRTDRGLFRIAAENAGALAGYSPTAEATKVAGGLQRAGRLGGAEDLLRS